MDGTKKLPFDLHTAQNSLDQYQQLQEILQPNTEDELFEPLNIHQAEKTIQAFKKLPFNQAHRKSFIEIMGLSHLENVSSKTLAFFLDSKEEHKFNDLVINALFSVLGESLPYQIHTENIILEKRTDQGRIDL